MNFSLHMYELESLEASVAIAQRAEEIGLEAFHISERIQRHFPTWPTLFMMAQGTTRIGLGPGVTNPYSRHPAITAKMAALLDNFSEGRAMLGIGHGRLWQFRQLGIGPERPLQTLREAVQIIKHFLSGNTAAFEGDVFSAPEGFNFPFRPYGDDLQIFIGSHSPKGMALAGEVADKLDIPMCVAPEVINAAHQQLRLGSEQAQRNGDQVLFACSPQLSLSTDRDAAIRRAQRNVGRVISWMDYPTELMGIEPEEVRRLTEAQRSGDREYLYKNVNERLVEAFNIAGTPADVIEQMERLADLGLTRITFNQPGPNQEEAFALLEKAVLSHFAG